MLKRSLVPLLLCIVDTFDIDCCCWLHYIICSLRCIVFNCLWLNYLTLCKGRGLGLGLEVQSLGLGLDQKGLVLVLVLGNFWSLGLGLGLEEKVLFTSLDLCVVCDGPSFKHANMKHLVHRILGQWGIGRKNFYSSNLNSWTILCFQFRNRNIVLLWLVERRNVKCDFCAVFTDHSYCFSWQKCLALNWEVSSLESIN